MSIANLFSPNDYDLFCKSITTSGLAPIDTNTIDTVNPGDTLSLGPVKAGAVSISHPGAVTTINDRLDVGTIRTDNLESLTFGPIMQVGTNALGLTAGPLAGDMVVDARSLVLDTLYLGVGNYQTVSIGKSTGTIAIVGPTTWPGDGSGVINDIEVMNVFNGTGGGCIPATPNFLRFAAFKVNALIVLRWRFTGVPTLVTAISALTIAETLPVNFRPPADLQLICGVIGQTAAPGTTFPGIVKISTLGVISFEYIRSSHISFWTTADVGGCCGVMDGSAEYTFTL